MHIANADADTAEQPVGRLHSPSADPLLTSQSQSWELTLATEGTSYTFVDDESDDGRTTYQCVHVASRSSNGRDHDLN